MPNWCENTVNLVHSDTSKVLELESVLLKYPTERDELLGVAREKEVRFFDYFLPRPSDVMDNEVCSWNQEAWGTKWEPQLISFKKESDTEISVIMDTAWNPPIGVYEYFVQEGWNVEAFYHEPNCAFCGRFTNLKGDECFDYDENDMTTLQEIPKDVLEFTCILDKSACESDNDTESETESDCDSDDEIALLGKLYKQERNASSPCFNKIVLSHKNTTFINELEAFLTLTIQGHDYEIFNLLFPRPPKEDLDEGESELDWNIAGWGTPCEPEIVSFARVNDNTIEFVCNTAYTPPINLYNFLVSEEWDIQAWYLVETAQVCGRFTNKDEDVQFTYNKNDETSIANLPSDILQFLDLLQ